MPRNVEIKAIATDLPALTARAAALADHGPIEIHQDDTFFRCDGGRLKLRALSDSEGELIFYRRPDRPGPKESFYVVSPTKDPEGLRRSLALAYGETGRVVKDRLVFMVGRTRIHLDRVRNLGDFVELEVVLGDDEPIENGVEEARKLMALLGVDAKRLIEGAYVDLLARRE